MSDFPENFILGTGKTSYWEAGLLDVMAVPVLAEAIIGHIRHSDCWQSLRQVSKEMKALIMPAVKCVLWKGPLDDRDGQPAMMEMIPVPVCAKLESVTIALGGISATMFGVEEVIQSLHNWPDLKHIDLTCVTLEAAGIGDVLSTYPGSKLQTLRLSACRIDDEQLHRLMQAPFVGQLRSLDLSHNSFSRLSMAAVASACTELTQLDLKESFHGNANGHSLDVPNGSMPKLQALNLEYSDITAIDVWCLAHVEWNDIKMLNLEHSLKGSEGVAALATASWCASLEILSLDSCQIGDVGLVELVKANFSSLLELDLGFNDIGPMGVTTLAANASRFPLLQKLELTCIQGEDEHLDPVPLDRPTLEAVAMAPWNVHLMDLNLDYCIIESGALDGLAQGSFPAMKHLGLGCEDVSPDDLFRFGSMAKGKYPALTSLSLESSEVEEANRRLAEDCMLIVLRGRMMNGA